MQCPTASIATSPLVANVAEEHTMTPTAVPARITIDFRDAMHPSRTWILGVGDVAPSRVDLLAFEQPPVPTPRPGAMRSWLRTGPSALSADCACPEFCERDHANE